MAGDRPTPRGVGERVAVPGLGFSTLDRLRDLPLGALKIDRSFVRGVGTETRGTTLVHAAIAFGQSLGLDMVAEGIETDEQLIALRNIGCPHGQGFLFAQPSAPEAPDFAEALGPWGSAPRPR